MPLSFTALKNVTRPGMGDGAQVFDHLLGGHADAGVLDGQRVGFGVGANADGERQVWIEHVAVGEQLEIQAGEGVGSVGDQLAQEDLALGVEGMDQDIEQLAGFSLKGDGGGGVGL